MKHLRRLLAALLAAALLTAAPVLAAAEENLEHFQPVNTYTPGTFRDVPASSWYAEGVEAAYELGLMQGTGKGEFEPGMTITLGETVALAARIHSIYHTGTAEFVQGSPWYQVYLDYAEENGIFTGEAAAAPNAYAHRDQFAAILASALPAEALEPINTVEDGMIPDVPEGATHYDAIYLLYRAGVLTGSDGKGTFHPDTVIDRSSVAALVTRLVQPDLRQTITLERQEGDERLSLAQDSLTLTVGNSARLSATVEPDGTAFTWTSSNPAVATVDGSGTVTSLAAGTATITVRTENASAACLVRVENELIPATGVGISIRQLDLDVGETFRLTASSIPANASNNGVYWDLTFPAALKVYLEWSSVLGITFHYTLEGKQEGLCQAGNLVYITTSGGPIGDNNFGYDYLRGLSGMFGISRTHCLTAEGLDVWGNDTQAILNRAKKQAEKLAASL